MSAAENICSSTLNGRGACWVANPPLMRTTLDRERPTLKRSSQIVRALSGLVFLALIAGSIYGMVRPSTRRNIKPTRQTTQEAQSWELASADPAPTSTAEVETPVADAAVGVNSAPVGEVRAPTKAKPNAKTHEAPSAATRRPFEAHCPRYAADGIGVYYLMEYSRGDDSYDFDVLYVKSVEATPIVVSADAIGVPADVAAQAGMMGGGANAAKKLLDVESDFGTSPNGSLRATKIWEGSREGSAGLVVVDTTTHVRRTVAKFDSGLLTDAVWLDNDTMLAGVSMRRDDSCELELVDIPTGRITAVFRAAPSRGDEPAFFDRLVYDSEGFAVFSVDLDTIDLKSALYRYDVATRSVRRLRDIADLAKWDYSPSRNMLVHAAYTTKLTESPLPE